MQTRKRRFCIVLATLESRAAYATDSAHDWLSVKFPPSPDQEEAVSGAPRQSASLYACSQTCLCVSVRFVSVMSLLKIISRLLVFAGVTVLTVLLLRYWLASKQYVFNREDVAKLAKQYAGEFGFACEKKLPLHFILFIFKAKLILVA